MGPSIWRDRGQQQQGAHGGGHSSIPSLGQHPAFISPKFDMLPLLKKKKIHLDMEYLEIRNTGRKHSFSIKKTTIHHLSYFLLSF